MSRVAIALFSAAALALGAAATGAAFSQRALHRDELALAVQQHAIQRLEATVAELETTSQKQPDWAAVAATVQKSVLIVQTNEGLGSGWVVSSGPAGSDLVTNFHVVADAWRTGSALVEVIARDSTLEGEVSRVDPTDDLAMVHVTDRFPALAIAPSRPALGDGVMAVGAPLGLADSVSVGLVSGFRSLEGSDYMQFSAAISPGNSGGPVVDRQDRVVAVASAKLVGTGVEALSLGVPVQTVCLGLTLRCASK